MGSSMLYQDLRDTSRQFSAPLKFQDRIRFGDLLIRAVAYPMKDSQAPPSLLTLAYHCDRARSALLNPTNAINSAKQGVHSQYRI